MKFDKILAIRIINKVGKEITAALATDEPEEIRTQLRRALNDITFLPEILHIDEAEKEIDVISLQT